MKYPLGGSYVAAAKRAISQTGHSVIDMADFPAPNQVQSEICAERVRTCDVYVCILGTRYGPPVVDRPELSYTELEFEAATHAGLSRLLFVLDSGAEGLPKPILMGDEFDSRLEAFKRRVVGSGLHTWLFRNPTQLEQDVESSLREVTGERRSPGSELEGMPSGSVVFVGRDLSHLADLLHNAPPGAVVGQNHGGLGGVGKTELAVHYVRAYRDRYRYVLWVTADTSENLGLGLAALSSRVQSPRTVAEAQTWAVDWLRTNRDWLLVLDDVQNIDDIEPLLESVAGNGQVLITTRRNPAAAPWQRHGLATLALGMLDHEASVRLLIGLTGRPDSASGRVLAEELGGLPLTLQLAAAYLRHHQDVGFDSYRRRLASRAGSHTHLDAPVSPSRAIVGVWQESLTALESRSPLAIQVVLVFAWLAPEALPEDVLRPLTRDRHDFDEALTVLASYHLITRAGGVLGMHRLAQEVARTDSRRGVPGTESSSAHLAARLLRVALPDDSWDNWTPWRLLLPHIDALRRRLGPGHTSSDVVEIGRRAALFRYSQGQTLAAVEGLEQVLAESRRVFGGHHPSTLQSGHVLARMYRSVGRTAEAVDLYGQVFRDSQRVLGPDSLATIEAADGSARALVSAGRLAEAIPLQEEAIRGFEQLLGQDHLDTLRSRRALADAYAAAGKLVEATALYERVVADFTRMLGSDHPDTLNSAAALAYAYASAGQLRRAIALFESTVATMQRMFDEDDLELLRTRHHLAIAYEAAGDLGPAVGLYEGVIADCRQLLDNRSTALVSATVNPGAWQARNTDNAIRRQLDRACTDYWELLRRADGEAREFSAESHRAAVQTILRNVTQGQASGETIETPVGVVHRYGVDNDAFVLVDLNSGGNVVSWTGSCDASGFLRLCSTLAANERGASATAVVDGTRIAGVWPTVTARLAQLLRGRSWDHCEFIRLDLPVVDIAFHGTRPRSSGSGGPKIIISAVSAGNFGPELELIARHTADPAVYLRVLEVAPWHRDAGSAAENF